MAVTTNRLSFFLCALVLGCLFGLGQAQQTVTADDEPPPFCELLPEPKSLVTLENTTLSTVVLGVQCGSLMTNVGVPYALNFQVEEDPTSLDTIEIEMNPPNLVNPVVENGQLVFMANLEGASISSPG